MTEPEASLAVSTSGNQLRLSFAGRLNATGAAAVWRPAMRAVAAARGHNLVLDLSAVSACDMAGASLLAAAEAAHGVESEIIGADERAAGLVARARATGASRVSGAPQPRAEPFSWHSFLMGFRAAGNGFSFIGEAAVATLALPRRHRMLRGSDLLRFADQAGVQALPLVVMLGFLMGLILAFQSAVPMRKFGAVLYVANLVSISLTRELGPLLAAVILAGRTASAFAAEIGTMKVNEEVDALVSMGLDPMTMLVLPRMAAALLVMPVMTLVLELAGLIGMAVVMKSFGFGLGIIEAQVRYLDDAGRPVRRADQGRLFWHRDRGDRLPFRARHGGRPARRRCVHDRRRGGRHRRHRHARWRIRRVL